MRDGRWKLVLPSKRNPKPMLFDLKTDAAEQHNVAGQHAEVVKQLLAAAVRARVDLGGGERKGTNVRAVGRAEKPTPRLR